MSDIVSLSSLKLVIFDVDGVFTDGRTWQDARGFWRRRFSVRDTMGVRALRKAGLTAIVVTSAAAHEIRHHMGFVGVDEFHDDCSDKRRLITEIAKRHGAEFSEIAIMTADEKDLELVRDLGCVITVPSAAPELLLVSRFVTASGGGDGAVLEACGMILRAGRFAGRERRDSA